MQHLIHITFPEENDSGKGEKDKRWQISLIGSCSMMNETYVSNNRIPHLNQEKNDNILASTEKKSYYLICPVEGRLSCSLWNHIDWAVGESCPSAHHQA